MDQLTDLKKNLLLLLFWVLILKIIILSVLFLSANCSFVELAKFGDVQSYLRIADSFPFPYSREGMQTDTIHYPLFPFFIWFFSSIFGGNLVLSGFFSAILISSLCSLVLYAIAKQFTQRAFEIALIFAVLPDKWAQVSVYPFSEPVFILFLLIAVYFHLKENFIAAYASLGLMLIARPLGIIFLFSFLIIDVLFKKRFFTIKYAVGATIPFLAYQGYLYILFHKLLLFAHAEEGGSWGGSVFSYPLAGLIEGLQDPNLLFIRKIYTLILFGFYLLIFFIAVYHFFKTKNFQLFSAIVIPYFIFTLFLKGDNFNWWMISLPRFLIPLAPFGFIFLFGKLSKKFLYVIVIMGVMIAVSYSVGGHIMHLHYQHPI